MSERKRIRGTTASYKENNESLCDLAELAILYGQSVGNIPEKISFGRAQEIRLLARAFLALYEKTPHGAEDLKRFLK